MSSIANGIKWPEPSMGTDLENFPTAGVSATGALDQTRLVVKGKWPRVATIFDEEWLEGEVVGEPASIVDSLRRGKVKADIFTFTQKVTQTKPLYNYYFEWENVAAIPLTTFDEWWVGLPQVTRKNVRRATRRGVVVREVELEDELLRGIVDVYNADQMRQGVPNGHYGKGFTTLKREVSTYSKVSQFIGAFQGTELLGYAKVVYAGPIASLMNIVAKNRHHDKRPMNALIAKAVEIACREDKAFLIYGKYHYGNKGHDALAEFKRRNGFTQINVPRYFIPLTRRGRAIMSVGLHRGLLGLLPERIIRNYLSIRQRFYASALTQRFLFGRSLDKSVVEEM